jgi:hypothetical protein
MRVKVPPEIEKSVLEQLKALNRKQHEFADITADYLTCARNARELKVVILYGC